MEEKEKQELFGRLIEKLDNTAEYEDLLILMDCYDNLEKELEKADSITQSCIFEGKEESTKSYRRCLNLLEKLQQELQSYKNREDKLREKLIDYIHISKQNSEFYKKHNYNPNVFEKEQNQFKGLLSILDNKEE